ncbi:MAG: MMPL family transporter [Proteobacteria bacterium]|nr:MMPL family transporter [Pseudomonadota bacterium]
MRNSKPGARGASDSIRKSSGEPNQVLGNRFFRIFAGFVLRFRWPLLLLTLAITGFMGRALATHLRVDTSNEAFLAPDDESMVLLNELRENFGSDSVFQVLVSGDVFTLPYLERLKKLHQDLADLEFDFKSEDQSSSEPVDKTGNPGPTDEQAADDFGFGDFKDDQGWGDVAGGGIIDEIISLINVRQTRWVDDALTIEGLFDKWPTKEELPAIEKRVLADKTLIGQVIDKTGGHSVIVIRTDVISSKNRSFVFEKINRVATAHQTKGFRVMVAGSPAVMSTMNKMTMSDTRITLLLANLVTLLVVIILFRHPLGVFGPMLVVIQAEIWTLGAMALTDTPITIISTILPAFLACVGISDSVHIQSVYRDYLKSGKKSKDAIVHTMATTGIPIFYTSLTTAVGLLSFRFASLGAICNMGTFGAFGVAMAFINSLVFLPIVLSFNRKSLLGLPAEDHKITLIDRFLKLCNAMSRPRLVNGKQVYSRRNSMLIVSACLTLVAVLGVSTIRVYHNALTWFPKDHPIRKAIEAFEDSVGGTVSLVLLMEAKEGKDLKDRELLVALEKLEKYILDYDDGTGKGRTIHNIISLLDPIRESWQAVNGNGQEFYKLPDTQRGVSDMVTLFENAGPEQLKHLATIDMEISQMISRVTWTNAGGYIPVREYVERGIEKFIGPKAVVKVTGRLCTGIAIISSLIGDLLKSFGLALVVITIIMILLFREAKLGMLSMIPNLLPILAVMGLMGFASIPLDVTTLMLGSLAIGIAVDDTIHFLHHFKAHYDEHGQVEQAIEHSFNHTGRAMVATSVILVMSYVCLFACELWSMQRFGMLVASTLALALLVDLCVLPALLRTFYKSRPLS